jgi:8-amino-7-oxononanoate synthase
MNAPTSSARILAGRTVTGPVSARITVDGRPYVNFFGAGYLALSGIPEIREAARRVLDGLEPFAKQLPAGHGATDPIFDEVERAAAAACGTQTSVYFASGYLIGMVGLASLDQAFDVLVLDESAHFSLRDAAKLASRPTFTFAHCDAESLREVLARHVNPGQRPLLLTDGAFATTGRIPPLAEYARAVGEYQGRLFIDESHAFGVVGDNGRGATEHCKVEHIASSAATLSKALCAHGAIIGCSPAVASRVRAVPPLVAACAGSPVSAAAASAALQYIAQRPGLRAELRATTMFLRCRLRQIGLDVLDSPAPIVSFCAGTADEMRTLQRRAFDRGIYIHHSTYIGAGPEGMIRCAVFRDHTRDDIEALIAALS